MLNYIGKIATVFLSETHARLSLYICRRNLFQKPHNFIHLNLCIALLLGYALFIGGADFAKNISVSYAIL